MMEIKWLHACNRDFLSLVEILNDTKNKAILRTEFVSSLLSGYWERYCEQIF